MSDEDIQNFVNLHLKIYNEPNVLQLSMEDKVKEMQYVLKKTSQNDGFLEQMNLIKSQFDLEFREAIEFAYKYGENELFEQLSKKEPNDELKKKIKYLVKEGKIEQINNIEALNSKTLEELTQMEKQQKTIMKPNLRGGPNSRTTKHIFPDSKSREVRRINTDGSASILPVESFYNHEDTIKAIYQGDIEFPEECKMAIDRCLEATKQLSAVTFVIENERCYIYTSKDITEKQKKVCSKWINSAIDDGEIGIFVYDREKDETYIPNEDVMRKEEASRYIKELNSQEREDR